MSIVPRQKHFQSYSMAVVIALFATTSIFAYNLVKENKRIQNYQREVEIKADELAKEYRMTMGFTIIATMVTTLCLRSILIHVLYAPAYRYEKGGPKERARSALAGTSEDPGMRACSLNFWRNLYRKS